MKFFVDPGVVNFSVNGHGLAKRLDRTDIFHELLILSFSQNGGDGGWYIADSVAIAIYRYSLKSENEAAQLGSVAENGKAGCKGSLIADDKLTSESVSYNASDFEDSRSIVDDDTQVTNDHVV